MAPASKRMLVGWNSRQVMHSAWAALNASLECCGVRSLTASKTDPAARSARASLGRQCVPTQSSDQILVPRLRTNLDERKYGKGKMSLKVESFSTLSIPIV